MTTASLDSYPATLGDHNSPWDSMDRTVDLDAALSFAIGRVEEQATLSGEPLNGEQRLLLNNLPSSSPAIWLSARELPPLVPRDVNYERLCALGKTAYLNDRQVNPASLDWEFASAVFKLNRHPMWGLLHFAGVKQRRPRRDYFFLAIGALVFIVATMSLILLAGKEPWTIFKWIGLGSGYAAIMLLMHFASRRIEEWQLEKDIERCRLGSRFLSTVG
jgi:hypothetical protein